MIDTFSTKKKKSRRNFLLRLSSLEVNRSMSHAASCTQRCAQCGEETYQNLNHHLPL